MDALWRWQRRGGWQLGCVAVAASNDKPRRPARLEERGTLKLVATDAGLPSQLQNKGARGVVLVGD